MPRPFVPTEFGRQVKRLRAQTGLSQRSIDDLAGIASGTTARLEGGRYARPPTADLCGKLDQALGLDPGTLWRFAAAERLQHFDPNVYAWHQARVAEASRVNSEEVHLIEELRAMDGVLGMEGGACAALLADLLMVVGSEAAACGAPRPGANTLRALATALDTLTDLPSPLQIQTLRAITATLDVAAATQDPPHTQPSP